MSRVPATHRARSHAELRTGLSQSVRAVFGRPAEAPRWDPLLYLDPTSVDLGRGVLDSVALALHVLWTYQQAWAEETFLATARLESSVSKLLGHIGYQPSPGTAALGLQVFRAKAGTRSVLPAGFAVSSKPQAEEPKLTFETLGPLRLQPELNALQAFLPPRTGTGTEPGSGDTGSGTGSGGGTGTGSGTGGNTGTSGPLPSEHAGEPQAPAPTGGLFGKGSVLEALKERIEVQRHGPLEARRAARAKQEARRLAGMIKQLELDGDPACKEAMDELCKKLCEAQKVAAQPVPPPGRPVGALSESQEILARQLRNLEKRQKEAVTALEAAIAPCEGEESASYAKRLDQLTSFLDAFVGSLLQEARDQVVLLRGSAALNRLDAAFGAGAEVARALGTALPGTDAVYLLPLTGADGSESPPPIRPGDWLVVAEDVERLSSDGKVFQERIHREAVRVLRVREETPPGEQTRMTQIQFAPPLARYYALNRVTLIGNVAPVSEGSTVEEVGTPSADGRALALSEGPLTWLRDSRSASGRRPEVQLTVGGRAWRRVDSLLEAGPDEPVFAVEPLPGGKAWLRLGGDGNGAPLPSGAEIRIRYRVGLGAAGNLAPLRIQEMTAPHPAVESTFNPLPMAGGAVPEPTKTARTRGPFTVGAMNRAVSASDVEHLALVFDGVHRARVFKDGVQRRSLALVVSGPGGAPLNDAELQSLSAFMAARVPPGVEVALRNRTVVEVRARILLRVEPTADPVAVLQEARLCLGIDVNPDRPPGLLAPDRVELGKDLELSELYGALSRVPGLRSCVVQLLFRAEAAPALAQRIVTAPSELLRWAPPSEASGGVEFRYEEAKDL